MAAMYIASITITFEPTTGAVPLPFVNAARIEARARSSVQISEKYLNAALSIDAESIGSVASSFSNNSGSTTAALS